MCLILTRVNPFGTQATASQILLKTGVCCDVLIYYILHFIAFYTFDVSGQR